MPNFNINLQNLVLSDAAGFALADAINNAVGSGVAFDPTSIAGLVAWHDLSNTDSVTYDGGTFAISQVDDLSGNGRHLARAQVAIQPTYNVAGGYMETDGGDNMFMTWDVPAAYTVVVLAKYSNPNGNSKSGLFSCNANLNEQVGFDNSSFLRATGMGIVQAGVATTDLVTIAAAYGELGEASSVWVNGDEYTGTRQTPVEEGYFHFLRGNEYAPAGTRIYKVAVYERKLTSAEIASVVGYFNA